MNKKTALIEGANCNKEEKKSFTKNDDVFECTEANFAKRSFYLWTGFTYL